MSEPIVENAPVQESAVPTPRRFLKIIRIIFILLLAAALLSLALIGWLRKTEIETYLRFGVRTIHSPADADGDGLDDYTDLMLAARRYIETSPEYVSTYFGGGYPPEGQGVCTDVIWRALKEAGYDFKAMVDADISENSRLYPLPNGLLDTNIDFRRVVNLRVYFDRHCLSLTTDPAVIDQWQPGDIVFYEGHVAVVSDQRNDSGQPYIIHHTGDGALEADQLTYRPILAHYRWTAPK